MKEWLEILLRGEALGADRTEAAFEALLDRPASDAQIAAFLVALRMAGFSAPEVEGAARVLRKRAIPMDLHDLDPIDIVGTGGDGSSTFNISTAAAIVCAAAGVKVAKHGNVSVSSKSGSADVLRELGIAIDASPEVVAHSIREAGIGFLFARLYHPAMKQVAKARAELGVRTIFNVLGPLCNPASVRRLLLGVYSLELVDVCLGALKNLGTTHAWVVHGHGGLDEIAIKGKTQIAEIRAGMVRTFTVQASDFGLQEGDPSELVVESPRQSADRIRAVLAGKDGSCRIAVVLNAAAALYIAGAAKDIASGARRAQEVIDSGIALSTVERWSHMQGNTSR